MSRIDLLAVALAAIIAGGCKKESAEKPSPSTEAPPNGTGGARATATEAPTRTTRTNLRIATVEPKSLDPAALQDAQGLSLVLNILEGLVIRDAKGGPVPGQAERWTISDDGKTYTFHLRKGLLWSDGTPLTAEDFVWTYRRALDPGTKNEQSAMLYPIKGAEAYGTGKTTDPATLGVRAPDAATVVIELERPYPELLRLISLAFFAPVPRGVVEKHGAKWMRPGNFVGNGPYVISARKHGESLNLKRNERYWDASRVLITDVGYRFSSSMLDGSRWYKLDEIDWSHGLVGSEEVTEMLKRSAPELRIGDYDGMFYVMVNTSRAPMNDPVLRRAIDLGIDRYKLTRHVLTAAERPARSYLPSSMTGASAPRRGRYDPARARRMLKEAGYGPDKPLPEIELLFNTNQKNRAIAAFLQRNLKENLNLQIRLHNVEWGTYLDRLQSGEFELGQMNVGGFDAIDFLNMLRGDLPIPNRAHWKNDEFDRLLAQAVTAPTLTARDKVISGILALLDREMPQIPLYQLTRQNIVRPGLGGFHDVRDNFHPIRWMYWE